MAPTASEVIAEIESVFPASRAVQFVPMANSLRGDEPQLTAEAFSDKEDWTELDPHWLDEAPDGLASALNFLADEALCFYIPAYIVADLRGQLERSEPTFQLTHGFDNFSRDQRIWSRNSETWTDFAKARWSHLTRGQARAIVQYLEWRINKDGREFAYPVQEALSGFWYHRASAEWKGS